jgi:hypothetical protein
MNAETRRFARFRDAIRFVSIFFHMGFGVFILNTNIFPQIIYHLSSLYIHPQGSKTLDDQQPLRMYDAEAADPRQFPCLHSGQHQL